VPSLSGAACRSWPPCEVPVDSGEEKREKKQP